MMVSARHMAAVSRWTRRAVRASAVVVLAASVSACANLRVAPGAVTVDAIPIALAPQSPTIDHIGPLAYRGGLYLHTRNPAFGGLSGLLISEDGSRMLAVSDNGTWWTAKLDYREGRLTGLSGGVRMSHMLGANGAPLQGKGEADSESLTAAGGTSATLAGPFYVGFERDHRICLYPNPFTLDWMSEAKALPTCLDLPPDVLDQPSNGGLESVTALDSETLLAFSEEKTDKNGNIVGWLIPAHNPKASGYGALALVPSKDFKPSDVAVLPDGDVIVLERAFSFDKGAAMQLRRIKRSDIKPGAKLDGVVLARLDVTYSIDNMEGVAVRKDATTGETLIYLISDNNFNGLQRTVLLVFALTE